MEAGGHPPSALMRRVTFVVLALVTVWWCLLLAFAVLAASALAAVEWAPPTPSKYIAPLLAILASVGAMIWLRRDRVSHGPMMTAAALLVLTIPLSFSLYGLLVLAVLFSAMAVDPGG